MAAQFETSLSIVLEQLGKKGWTTILIDMEQKFRSIQISQDTSSFGDELLNTLWSLQDAKKHDENAPLLIMFAIRFSKLDFWTLRFTKLSAQHAGIYLNPLTASASDLSTAVILQAGSAYPAEDIIKRWVRENLQ